MIWEKVCEKAITIAKNAELNIYIFKDVNSETNPDYICEIVYPYYEKNLLFVAVATPQGEIIIAKPKFPPNPAGIINHAEQS